MKKQFFPSFLAALFLMNALHASAPELNRVIDQLLRSDISGLSDIDQQTESQFYESLKIDANTFWQTVAPQIANQALTNKTAESCQVLISLTAFKSDDSIRLDHGYKALSIAQELKNENLICHALLRIARIPHQGDLAHATEALRMANQLNNQRLILDALLIIARIPGEGQLTRATEALTIARQLKDQRFILDVLISIARIPHQGDLAHATEALTLAKGLNDRKKIEAANKIITSITWSIKRQSEHANLFPNTQQAVPVLPIPQQPQQSIMRQQQTFQPFYGVQPTHSPAYIPFPQVQAVPVLPIPQQPQQSIMRQQQTFQPFYGVQPTHSPAYIPFPQVQAVPVLPIPQPAPQSFYGAGQMQPYGAAQMWTYPPSFFPPQQ
ncbi:MAG: hypothetical protein CNLJKLNK_00445 [Holosporales bacterium]